MERAERDHEGAGCRRWRRDRADGELGEGGRGGGRLVPLSAQWLPEHGRHPWAGGGQRVAAPALRGDDRNRRSRARHGRDPRHTTHRCGFRRTKRPCSVGRFGFQLRRQGS